jgi:RNA polymerase sigma-70 factor (ECF subfamily)
MIGAALDRVFRAAGGRIIGALAARFRNLDLAEDAFAEACARALRVWPQQGLPEDPAAWLFRVAQRVVLDTLRQQGMRSRLTEASHDAPPALLNPEEVLLHEDNVIPDERLRLIFICCHPAIAPDSRAALTLRLVCGLTVTEIARAFLVTEMTLAQRLVRAKRKIAEAGVPFEMPEPEQWPERLDAVLSTVEVAYAKAHEDAAGVGPHASYASEMLHLSKLVAELVADSAEAQALAAIVCYAEARRPARVDADGIMIPLSEQNPERWRRDLIEEADGFLSRAQALDPTAARTLQAMLQAAWCERRSLAEPAPWPLVLRLYDRLLAMRDDAVVRLNRLVALAQVAGATAALEELANLDTGRLAEFAPFHAVRAELLARAERHEEARQAYDAVLALNPSEAERRWLARQVARITGGA